METDSSSISEPEAYAVLVATADPDNQVYLQHVLQGEGYSVFVCSTGYSVLTAIATYRPDALLIDPEMDHGEGIEVAFQVHMEPETYHIPILFLMPARPEPPAF